MTLEYTKKLLGILGAAGWLSMALTGTSQACEAHFDPVSPWVCWEDADCGECALCDEGMCTPVSMAQDCANDADCGPVGNCVSDGCSSWCEVDHPSLCEASGGVWDQCGSGCGPMNCDTLDAPTGVCPDHCVEMCACPADLPLWDSEAGCIAAELCDIERCEESGGIWETCPTPECAEGMPCETQCQASCGCPDEAPDWNEFTGCQPPTFDSLCTGTGGIPACVGSCPLCTDCILECACPSGATFVMGTGCTNEPTEWPVWTESGTPGFRGCQAQPGPPPWGMLLVLACALLARRRLTPKHTQTTN